MRYLLEAAPLEDNSTLVLLTVLVPQLRTLYHLYGSEAPDDLGFVLAKDE
jgi:hypothetical protein